MTTRKILALSSAFAVSFVLATNMASAQQAPRQGQASGTTSGPAAGTNVEPSAATQKKAHTPNAEAVSTGAPGVEAAKGSESGTKPKR